MKADIRLGRIFGIEIGLHYSWLIIALLIGLSLAGHFHATNPQWSPAAVWISAVLTAALFFTSIVLHELSHAAVARARGLPVKSITLFALGGLAQIERDAADPKSEFWMGIVGPIASALIGLVCLALAYVLGGRALTTATTPPVAILAWLGTINLILAAFNMIPGFPLDGGRVLRAALWWKLGDQVRATRIAAQVGQAVALAFIALGFLRFFAGAGFGGLWLAFIGWFLLDAARASAAQVEASSLLRNVPSRDVMARDCPVVPAQADLRSFVDDYVLRTGRRCFVVSDDGRVSGLITPHEVKEVGRERWQHLTVADVMRPVGSLHTIQPETPVSEALETMVRDDVNQLPVVADGRLEGILTRDHVLRYLQTRAELQM